VTGVAFTNVATTLDTIRAHTYYASQDGQFDDFYFCKYVNPEPAQGVWGSQENEPIAHSITVTELIGGLDSYSRNKIIYRTYSELLGLKDTGSRVKSYFRSVTELLGLKDSKLFLHNIIPIITAGIGKVFKEIEVLTRIKIPITFSKKYSILTFLSDLSSTQLQEILRVKSDYTKAVMLNLFQIDMPVSYNKIDELIIKLTSSLIHHKNEKLLQVLINMITLKEIMEFLNEED
jgi:hypothetical protein